MSVTGDERYQDKPNKNNFLIRMMVSNTA